MLNLEEIHRPTTLAEALQFLQQPDTVPLAGGTQLIAGARRDVRAVVDLSGLGLGYIRENQGRIGIGATTTLSDLVESPMLRAWSNGILAQAAHRTAASVLRNQETVAGTLIVEPDGVLATAFLATDASVTVVRKESRTVPLKEFLAMRDHLLMMALLTEVSVSLTTWRASLQVVARTPSDKPIVSACVSAQIENGVARQVRVALGGVGATAVRATATEQMLEGQPIMPETLERAAELASEGLAPVGDYRGSVEYRKEMAVVLTRRALRELSS
jgi:carbon-monoxide dehydrogenase medium subunit